MNSTRLAIASALAAALVLPAATSQAQGNMEKCYGIAKAGKNDCQTATSSCAGTSKKDAEASAWLSVPKGTCEKIVGGKLKSFDAKAVMGLPGVKQVVPVGDTAVAVVAAPCRKRRRCRSFVFTLGAHHGVSLLKAFMVTPVRVMSSGHEGKDMPFRLARGASPEDLMHR